MQLKPTNHAAKRSALLESREILISTKSDEFARRTPSCQAVLESGSPLSGFRNNGISSHRTNLPRLSAECCA